MSDQTGAPFLRLLDIHGDPQTASIWSEAATTDAWLEVEIGLAHAQADVGLIPVDAAGAIEAHLRSTSVDVANLRAGSRQVGYPILPLLEQLSASGPSDVAAYLHWGATTQDVMDSALAMQLGRSLDRIDALVGSVGDGLRALAVAHRGTLMAARTHGQPAVPTTFGAKVATYLAEFARHKDRVARVRREAALVSLYGAGGTSAAMGGSSRAIRSALASRLALGASDVPWHTARDALADVAFVCAAIAATCGRLGREVASLSRPEIGEVSEESGHHRGASSTMPQKANPITSEAIIGMSLFAAGQCSIILAAMQPGHERATGEWQAEWDSLPLVVSTCASSLSLSAELVRSLQVDVGKMRTNVDRDGGSIMAEAAMMHIARLTGRARAHDLVYEACRRAKASGQPLRRALESTLPADVMRGLPPIERLLSPDAYLGEAAGPIVDAALAAWDRSGGIGSAAPGSPRTPRSPDPHQGGASFDPRGFANRYVSLLVDRRLEEFLTLWADDATLDYLGTRYTGKSELRDLYRRLLSAGGRSSAGLHRVAGDEQQVVYEWWSRKHHEDGRVEGFAGVDFLTLRDGLITESRVYMDPGLEG